MQDEAVDPRFVRPITTQKPFMSPKDTRIVNLTRNTRLKLHQAESRIASGVAAWVERGVSIRELNLAEMQALRSVQRHIPDELPAKEIEGVVERMPRSDVWTPQVKYDVLAAARQYCAEHTSFS